MSPLSNGSGRVTVCAACGASIPYRGRGRPRRYCAACEVSGAKQRAYYEANRDEIAAKKRAYREANRDEIAAKQRAYYEANRDEIAAKKRARDNRLCVVCGEHMRQPSETGMCGFCEHELEGQAA